MRPTLLLLACALAGCGPDVDREDAVQYLAAHRDALKAARAEIVPMVPPGRSFDLEEHGGDVIDFLVRGPERQGHSGENSAYAWNVAENDLEVARGLEMLGWSPEDLRRVRERIATLDVIALEAPIRHGGLRLLHRRGDDGLYWFVVADSALVPTERIGYNGCDAHWLDQQTGLVFTSGTIGPACMPGGDVTARY